jgi:hypothetical protein
MFIPDPDFYPSRIPDLGSRLQKKQQREGRKKIVVIPFYVATNFTKLKIILPLKCRRKKKKIVIMLSKIWVWDPGSGKNLFQIQGSKRHRIPDPDPQHWTAV